MSEHDLPQRTRSRRSSSGSTRAVLARMGRSGKRMIRAIARMGPSAIRLIRAGIAGLAMILVLGGTGPSLPSEPPHGGAANSSAYSHQQPHNFHWPPTTLAITEPPAEGEIDSDPGTSGPPRPGDTSRDSEGDHDE